MNTAEAAITEAVLSPPDAATKIEPYLPTLFSCEVYVATGRVDNAAPDAVNDYLVQRGLLQGRDRPVADGVGGTAFVLKGYVFTPQASAFQAHASETPTIWLLNFPLSTSVTVTGISQNGSRALVEYEVNSTPSSAADTELTKVFFDNRRCFIRWGTFGRLPFGTSHGLRAHFKRYDDGWRVVHIL